MNPETAREIDKSVKEETTSGLNLVSINKSGDTCTEDTNIKQLAKVGPFVQSRIDKDIYCEGAAHPSDEHIFSTTNKVTMEPQKLQDIFKKEDIYNALMKDKMVQTALELNKDNLYFEHPKDFDELQADLSGKDGLGLFVDDAGKKDSDGNDVTFRLNDKILSDFAFHNVKGNFVGTRLLMDYTSEASRNAMYQLGVYLPIPPGMARDFQAAANHTNGSFLMKDSAKFGKTFTKHREWESPRD